MTTYNVDLSQFVDILKGLDPKIEKAIIRGLRSAARRMQGFAVEEIEEGKPYPPVDRGELRQSVEYDNEETGGIVHVDAPHAKFMEWGTRPHRPPLKPILEWVLRKKLAGGGLGKKVYIDDDLTAQVRSRAQFEYVQVGEGPRRRGSRRADDPLFARRRVDSGFRDLNDDEDADFAEALQLARAIQAKIARDGIAPRYFMAKAFHRTLPVILKEVEDELKELRP